MRVSVLFPLLHARQALTRTQSSRVYLSVVLAGDTRPLVPTVEGATS